MNQQEWVSRFSARLHAQWPRLPREQRDEVASELMAQEPWKERLQGLEPEAAAVVWLSHGILLGQDRPEPIDAKLL